MNETEISLLTVEKLLQMYEEVFDYAKELEEKVEELQSQIDDYDYEAAYDEGLEDGKRIGYAEGLDAGYEACEEDINLRITESAR